MQWLTNIIRWFQVGLLAHVETFLIITYHCNLDPHSGIDHMSYPHPFRLAMCELTSTNTHTVAVIAIMFALVSFVHIKTWLSTHTLCKTNSEETPEKVACFAQSFHNPFFFAMFSTGLVIVIYMHCPNYPEVSWIQIKSPSTCFAYGSLNLLDNLFIFIFSHYLHTVKKFIRYIHIQ